MPMTAVFQSTHHPGAAPLSLVLVRAQAQPVSLALLGVCVVTFAALLGGTPVLGTLAWAAPLAYALAAAWSVYELHRRPAEIVLRRGFGAVRSVWDVAAGRDAPSEFVALSPVFPPFRKDGQLHVAIGDAIVTLRPAEWPAFDDLAAALRATAEELQGHVAA
jgi:hypothetical protein